MRSVVRRFIFAVTLLLTSSLAYSRHRSDYYDSDDEIEMFPLGDSEDEETYYPSFKNRGDFVEQIINFLH